MATFNTKLKGTKTVNLAGGVAYSQENNLELVSILLTSFANDSFYRTANDTFERLKELVKVCDKKFVAKAVVYARTQFGMRSITHVVASELAKYISKEDWAKDFYFAMIHRPDDMTETIAYHKTNNGKLTNSMKKGFAKAFDKFDAYSLAKYRGENKGIKLVDVVNLVHPKPIEKNSEAINLLVKGELKSFDTWETELTRAGQNTKNEEEKTALKKQVWINLIKENKIGYFALLRNLRNIIEQAPEVVNDAIELLTNENLIKKSLVLPFRYLTAFDEIKKLNASSEVRNVMIALNKAVDISINNVPKFDGENLVVLDVSGSMNEYGLGNKSPHIIGSLFSSVLIRSNNCDFMTFDNTARYINVNPLDSTITIANTIPFNGGGTNFHSIFQTATKKYDRIIILSDMQGWIGHYSPIVTFNEYKSKTNSNPFIYSFDLKNYGTMQFPSEKTFCLAGFSEKVFEIMLLLEKDKNALINEINKVVFVVDEK